MVTSSELKKRKVGFSELELIYEDIKKAKRRINYWKRRKKNQEHRKEELKREQKENDSETT